MRLKRLIAWTIYEERQKQGLSRERLGKMAGCHRTTIAKIEAEELQSMDLVEAILAGERDSIMSLSNEELLDLLS